MDKSQIKAYIAKRAAMELKDGDVVNLGIGLPTMLANYLPEDVQIILQSENGIVNTGAKPSEEEADALHVIDAGGSPASVKAGGCFIGSSMSFSLIRGGHVDCSVLGAMEVDQFGNLANWIIPGKKVAGMGGAMDLVVGAKKVIITMEHTAKGNHKILEKCTLPLTAENCVDLIITEMGVMRVTDKGLVLEEYNPEFTVEQIQEATGAKLIISENLKEIPVTL